MHYYTGIDIGSAEIKIVIINEDDEIIARGVTPSGSKFNQNTNTAYSKLLNENNILRTDIAYIVVTGYGRKHFEDGNEVVNEITANVKGLKGFNGKFSDVRTIINIGGQDTKIISLDETFKIQNFVMNDKCAAGTGRFLEMASRSLEIPLDDFGKHHAKAKNTSLSINSTCAVFAESEIISLLASGNDVSEIIAAIHYSIGKRIISLSGRIEIKGAILVDGGTALNKGLTDAIETELMMEVKVTDDPQVTTAYGAAIMAKEAYQLKHKNNIVANQ